MRFKLVAAAFGLLLIGGWWAWTKPEGPSTAVATGDGDELVAISLPAEFTEQEQMGATAFSVKCADCHGVNGVGRDGIAPPLIHKIYEPSHHGDASFERAALLGVRAHHWPFGNMPPVEGLTPADTKTIVAYVRAIQRANGIN